MLLNQAPIFIAPSAIRVIVAVVLHVSIDYGMDKQCRALPLLHQNANTPSYAAHTIANTFTVRFLHMRENSRFKLIWVVT